MPPQQSSGVKPMTLSDHIYLLSSRVPENEYTALQVEVDQQCQVDAEDFATLSPEEQDQLVADQWYHILSKNSLREDGWPADKAKRKAARVTAFHRNNDASDTITEKQLGEIIDGPRTTDAILGDWYREYEVNEFGVATKPIPDNEIIDLWDYEKQIRDAYKQYLKASEVQQRVKMTVSRGMPLEKVLDGIHAKYKNKPPPQDSEDDEEEEEEEDEDDDASNGEQEPQVHKLVGDDVIDAVGDYFVDRGLAESRNDAFAVAAVCPVPTLKEALYASLRAKYGRSGRHGRLGGGGGSGPGPSRHQQERAGLGNRGANRSQLASPLAQAPPLSFRSPKDMLREAAKAGSSTAGFGMVGGGSARSSGGGLLGSHLGGPGGSSTGKRIGYTSPFVGQTAGGGVASHGSPIQRPSASHGSPIQRPSASPDIHGPPQLASLNNNSSMASNASIGSSGSTRRFGSGGKAGYYSAGYSDPFSGLGPATPKHNASPKPGW